MTYAIIKTGGKQYRVEQGQSLLIERLPAADGESVALEPLLFVDGSDVVDGEGLARVSVEARVVGHERGPKLRVVKFKPKRGYKRRTGHRQELTRIEVTSLGLASSGGRPGGRGSRAREPVAAEPTPAEEVAADPTPAGAVAPDPTPAGAVAADPTPAESVAPDPNPAEEATDGS